MLLYERTQCEAQHQENLLTYSCDLQTRNISYENDAAFGQGSQTRLRRIAAAQR